MTLLRYIACAVVCPIIPPAFAQVDLEYGAYLSGECTICHQTNEAHGAIPSITHLSVADFSAALRAYRSKTRAHPAMQVIAGRLTDDDIAALAAYFSSLE